MPFVARPILTDDALSSGDALPRWAAVGVEGLLFAALAFAPFAFGAIEAWSQRILLALVFAALFVLGLGRLRSRRPAFVWTWAYVPIAILLGAACLQLVPLPAGVVQTISPGTSNVRNPLLSLAGQPITDRATLSLYPLATERQLRLLLGGAAVFVLIVQYYGVQERRRLRRLLLWITGVGLGIVLLALWQNFSGSRTIYGLVLQGTPYSGPFANHSHFGQFLNLSIGAAIALLLIRIGELRRRGLTRAGISEELQRGANWDLTPLILFVILGPIAIFLSLTRGGTVALLIAGAITVLLIPFGARRATSGASRDTPIAGGFAIGFAILIVLLAVGFDVVYDRLATMRHVEQSSEGRFEIIRDAVALWRTFPLFGSGLGTHAFVFPMFDRSVVRGWASYAENEYVQLLEETGAVGLGCLLAFAAIVVASFVRGMRSISIRRTSLDVAMVQGGLPGLAFGLIAVAISSWTDFGQHLPAVSFLTAVTCGLIVTISRRSKPGVARLAPLARTIPPILGRIALPALTLIAGGWCFAGATRDRDAETAWTEAIANRDILDARGWDIASPFFRQLLTRAQSAVSRQPADVEYAFWLNTWRWEAVAQQAGSDGTLDDQLRGWTQNLVDALRETVTECPTFGRPMAFAGALELRLNPKSATARQLIDRGAKLATYDAQASLNAGAVAATDGRVAEATALLRRAVAMGASDETALGIFVNVLHDPAGAIDLAGDDLQSLQSVSDLLAARPEDAAVANGVRAALDRKLAAQAGDPAAPLRTLDMYAERLMRDKQNDQAIILLSRAVAMQYGNVDRRLRLAALLSQCDRADEALAQARICLRLRPGFQPQKKSSHGVERQLRVTA